VLFGRLLPAVRTLISVPAGLADMPMAQFLLYSGIGSLVWTGVLMAAGFLLEDKYTEVAKYVDPVSKVILGLLLAGYLYRVVTYRAPAKAPEPVKEEEELR
jgi:membrane protein DedA with SNARE-associated domain